MVQLERDFHDWRTVGLRKKKKKRRNNDELYAQGCNWSMWMRVFIVVVRRFSFLSPLRSLSCPTASSTPASSKHSKREDIHSFFLFFFLILHTRSTRRKQTITIGQRERNERTNRLQNKNTHFLRLFVMIYIYLFVEWIYQHNFNCNCFTAISKLDLFLKRIL